MCAHTLEKVRKLIYRDAICFTCFQITDKYVRKVRTSLCSHVKKNRDNSDTRRLKLAPFSREIDEIL